MTQRFAALAPILLILVAAASRLIPHPPNFTPMVGLALFSGATLATRSRALSYLLPLAALLLSDIVLGFHAYMPFTYGAFALITWLGGARTLGRAKSPAWPHLAGTALFSSLVFFLLTNFGVWALGAGNYYPFTALGLATCFVAGIPFFWNAMAGDLFYTLSLFALYALWTRGSIKRPLVCA